MKNISEIDKNFKVDTTLTEEDIVFHDIRDGFFDIYGLYKDENYAEFKRMPTDVAKATNEGVLELHTHTTGGRVRFRTDSPYIAFAIEVPGYYHSSHMDAICKMGLDVYSVDDGQYTYVDTVRPPVDGTLQYQSIVYTKSDTEREYVVNMPLYGGITKMYIGIKEGCSLKGGSKYINSKPILYYGSSITQGGCASRPGTCYQAFISRKYDCDYINLGFSGSARGEDVIVDYMAGIDMCCFVMDYDHNAPTIEHLDATHGKVFAKIRQANPDLPIIILSSPTACFTSGAEEKSIYIDRTEKRKAIVERTYNEAIANGDKNVYFIDGLKMFGELGKDCTVDGCHPTDLGFYYMAKAIAEKIDESGIF